jgi:1-aminocyclopropane-1-carboxylate deaminase/D-cysteine desulfhydrase-like pyridoxal-dependent ACC family enzyme
MCSLSPAVQIDTLSLERGQVYVVRDDLLEGGTKQRAAVPYLTGLMEQGYEEFVYASPFCGFAQIALAVACKMIGAKCSLFCEKNPDFPDKRPHEFTLLAESNGAKVMMASNLAEAEFIAEEYLVQKPRAKRIALGFDCEEYKTHLRVEIEKQWLAVSKKAGPGLSTVWLPVGSGTLARVFRDFLPESIEIRGVNVHVLADTDTRISGLRSIGGISVSPAPQPFREKARIAPPVASNIYYDAKVWEFVNLEGRDGDVWWNVAR